MNAPGDRRAIAITGMAGRFPGAADLGTFWSNLRSGRDCVSWFDVRELIAAGVPADVAADPAYVPARGYLADASLFDADLFGYSPREAAFLDPQQRLLLECVHEALESACRGAQDGERTGVFAGAELSTYMLAMMASPRARVGLDPFGMIGNERDCVATRVAYKLNLTGPALTVQTACSTSLTAVHLAVQSLLAGECDTAVAGGVAITTPLICGYRYERGGAFAPDGRARTFDAQASGTVPGNGVGAVVLRRLADAVADKDPIRAIILGTAVNNDGAAKMGFTAPSQDGQAAVITAAHQAAQIDAGSVSYVEAHGTATQLGDPIEVAALTQAFSAAVSPAPGTCGLGSVKSAIGHLGVAAGVAGLIKTVLALEHRELPPTVHFRSPNPLLDLDQGPFYVVDQLREWTAPEGPRRAGVSAFGIGGTNVHVVVEEYPQPSARPAAEPEAHVVILSGHTLAACEQARERLSAAVAERQQPIADIAWSAAVGRKHLAHRCYAVARSADELGKAVEAREPSVRRASGPLRSVFIFPGAGVQHAGMIRDLYASEPVLRSAIGQCSAALRERHGLDLDEVFRHAIPGRSMTAPTVALPALFAAEYGVAALLAEWGIRPAAMIGHSVGEYVAAVLAGVFTVADAASLVYERARLSAAAGGGAMLSVRLPESELLDMLGPELAVAAVNSTDSCAVSGPAASIAKLAQQLDTSGVDFRPVAIQVAGHSPMLDPVLPAYRSAVAAVRPAAPTVPFVSNVTGTWISDVETTDPGYWAAHLRSTVRFAEGLGALLDSRAAVWLVGPGRSYAGWVRRHASSGHADPVLTCLASPDDDVTDRVQLLGAVGQYWSAGGTVDWPAVFSGRQTRRLPLPAYPYQRRHLWAVESPGGWMTAGPAQAGVDEHAVTAALDGEGAAKAAGAGGAAAGPDATPRSAVEREVAEIWSHLLGIRPVGIHDDFFELGGDSLLAIRVAADVRERLGKGVEPGLVARCRTIAAFARAMDDRATPVNGTGGGPDLRSAVRAAHARLAGLTVIPRQTMPAASCVLVTGGTGHLGPYLVNALLAAQPATVAVLVRAGGPDDAATRLRTALRRRGLWSGRAGERLVALPGNVSAPGLGLSSMDRRWLTERVRAIYHAAAEVNFLLPYERLERANVRGTEAAIELALASGARLHHLSTLGVLYSTDIGHRALGEEPLGPDPGLLATGYLQTKWVAERIVQLSAENDLAATVYRLGMVAGDSVTGRCNGADLFWRVVATCALIGKVPQRDATVTIASVDKTANALVALAQDEEAQGRTGVRHVVPAPVGWRTICGWLGDLGYPVSAEPYDSWLAQVAAQVANGEQLPVAPVTAQLPQLLPASGVAQPASEQTSRFLADSGLVLPPLDRDSFGRSIAYLFELSEQSPVIMPQALTQKAGATL